MCAPVPTPSASCSGANETRVPRRRATSRTTSLKMTLRSAAVTPARRGDRDLELALAVLGQERLRLDAGLAQRRHHLRAERLREPLRLEREGGRRPPPAPRARTRARTRLARAGPRAGADGRAHGAGRCVRRHPSRCRRPRRCRRARGAAARRSGHRSRRTRVVGTGISRRSPADPHGFGSARSPKAEIDWFAGTQPTPISRRRSSSESGTERPRTRPARSHVTRLTSSSPAAASRVSASPASDRRAAAR